MANYEATKYNYNAASVTGIVTVPTATIIPWSDSSVPSGYLECNGVAVSRTTYSALFAVIGTTYGSGNGSSTFNLPDLKNNIGLGRSNAKALASTGGADTVQTTGNVAGSTASHTLTTPELPSHSHTNSVAYRCQAIICPGQAPGAYSPGNTGGAGGGGGHSHNMSATFTGDSTSVLQPYLTLLYIIKT